MERNFTKIIREQKAELEGLLKIAMQPRDSLRKVDIESPLAQAVLGLRRSGKSVICRMALQNSRVSFGYVDFDDEALASLEASDLDDVLHAVYEVYGKVDYFFFDEIQNVTGWHLFVNRLLRLRKHVVITGSNAKLLNTELAAHLTGRHIPIEILPFSYGEFVSWIGNEDDASWKRYFFNGGLPETFALSDRRGYVSALYNAIVTKDILLRHKVRNARRFTDAAYVVMQQFAREIAYDNLAEKTGVSSAHTMQTYVGYLAEAYLVSLVRKFSFKPSERVRNDKLYLMDPALITYFTGVTGPEEELGWRLENIVYLELIRRRSEDDTEIFYYKDRSYDIDFCQVRHGKIVRLIQVAYTIEGQKTRKRELSALFGAGRKLKCNDLLLVTDHEDETVVENGLTIHVVSARKWLLS